MITIVRAETPHDPDSGDILYDLVAHAPKRISGTDHFLAQRNVALKDLYS